MTAQWYTHIPEYCDGTMVHRHGTLVPIYWDTVTAVVHRHGTVVHRHGTVVTVTAHWYTRILGYRDGSGKPSQHTGTPSWHSGHHHGTLVHHHGTVVTITAHWYTVTAQWSPSWHTGALSRHSGILVYWSTMTA